MQREREEGRGKREEEGRWKKEEGGITYRHKERKEHLRSE
jgi:hypothetical protein